MTDYEEFLQSKAAIAPQRGMQNIPPLNSFMFDYQKECTRFLLEAGSGAAFLDTGLGKSIIALDWGRIVSEYTKKPVLMLAPLAVSHQHLREAHKFGIDARVCQFQDDVGNGLNITNYERLHHFSPDGLGGIILDESSIIKGFNGKTTNALMQFAKDLSFKLCCTATPAPNDQMELGQHSQFLGVMDSNEMLARWFITDQQHMGKYRVKHHGIKSFWAWVASWARCLSKPSDIGYSDEGFNLPKLNLQRHIVNADITIDSGDMLFRSSDCSATSIHKEKRLTTNERALLIADIVRSEPSESWIVWCDTDYEADALKKAIPEATEVRGSLSVDKKEAALVGFSNGNIRVLITKPSIAGFGLNWQHCARMAFVGLSFSYESFYQAVRRCWRFGQSRQVDVHVAMANTEMNIWNTITRKTFDHNTMKNEMQIAMKNAHESRHIKHGYVPSMAATLPSWFNTKKGDMK